MKSLGINKDLISFPTDHREHQSVIEWWYWNGHLKDKDDNLYCFMNCFFRADLKKVNIPYLSHLPLGHVLGNSKYVYFAHSFVTDVKNKKSYKNVQDVSIVSKDSFSHDRLFINYIDPISIGMFKNFNDNEISETADNAFHIKTKRMDLTVKARKPALLEGGAGFVTVCGKGSYYYSLTDMEASGTIMIDGKNIEVAGRSWMDHQWADVPYERDKWTWFSMGLYEEEPKEGTASDENSIDIMCCEYDNGTTKDNLVDIIVSNSFDPKSHTKKQNKFSKPLTFHYKDLILKPGEDIWKSPMTKAKYPMSWDIEIPEYEARLHARSLVTDQEMIFMAINYWEGPIEITGTIAGKNVKGQGFMELVGYPSDHNYLLAYGKDIAKRIKDEITIK